MLCVCTYSTSTMACLLFNLVLRYLLYDWIIGPTNMYGRSSGNEYNTIQGAASDLVDNEGFNRVVGEIARLLGRITGKGLRLAVGYSIDLEHWEETQRCGWLDRWPIFGTNASVCEVDLGGVEQNTDGLAKPVHVKVRSSCDGVIVL